MIVSQYDSDLDIKHEPETWSDLVEKKVQRKLHAKDIKRQDVIYGNNSNYDSNDDDDNDSDYFQTSYHQNIYQGTTANLS